MREIRLISKRGEVVGVTLVDDADYELVRQTHGDFSNKA